MSNRIGVCIAASVLAASAVASAKITLSIDYSMDANGFFSTSTSNGLAARATLEAAADVYNDRILDTLTDITPSSSLTWTPSTDNPATGDSVDLPSSTVIAANTIKVFAGGRDEPGTTLGIGGPGGWSAGGNTAWFNTIRGRGNAGANATPRTDFAPWGGTIRFDTGTTWNYSATALPTAGQNDLYSVCLHELGHLMGFGTSESFTTTLTTNLQFTGAKAKALNGGANVPLANSGHFDGSLSSTVTGTGTQQPAMSPSIVTGTRKLLTLLDWAGLDDLGWDLARPGDANASGTIDFDDLLALAQNYGSTTGTWSEGDFNYDRNVNFDDLLSIAQAYGTSGPLLSDASMAGLSADFAADWALAQSIVPEPTTLALLATPLVVRRRRR